MCRTKTVQNQYTVKVLKNALLVAVVMFCFPGRGMAFEYDSQETRDPFVPLVGLKDEMSQGGIDGGTLSPGNVILQGIITSSEGNIAIINGEFLKAGDSLDHMTVQSVGKDVVVIEIDKQEYELVLYE